MSAPVWRTASRCTGGDCVQVAWVRSTACNNGNCLEVAHQPGEVWVRDSKLGDDSPVLRFTAEEFEAFVDGVKSGEFDLAGERSVPVPVQAAPNATEAGERCALPVVGRSDISDGSTALSEPQRLGWVAIEYDDASDYGPDTPLAASIHLDRDDAEWEVTEMTGRAAQAGRSDRYALGEVRAVPASYDQAGNDKGDTDRA